MITLGLNCGHDSGVTLLSDEKILLAVNEERFTRVKMQGGFPLKSLEYAKEILGGEIPNQVVFEGKRQFPFKSLNDPWDFNSNKLNYFLYSEKVAKTVLGNRLAVEMSQNALRFVTAKNRMNASSLIYDTFGRVEIKYVEHHLAHSSSSSLLFPMRSGLSFSLDAMGEGYCSSVFEVSNGVLKEINRTPAYHSLGLFYYYITRHLGFKIGQEGKVTGLAAHGDSRKLIETFRKLIVFSRSKGDFENTKLGYGVSAKRSLAHLLEGEKKEDIAAAAQRHLEEQVCEALAYWAKPNDNSFECIFLSGGVFANVSLNRRIAEQGIASKVFITPNMGDGGLSLGAAAYHHPCKVTLEELYLGPDVNISTSLKHSNWIRVQSGVDFLAREINEGKIVAICQGRMEFGPRALGNRTIIARATDLEVNANLNLKLNRNDFMPFAPIVCDIDATTYFFLTQDERMYENMVTTCAVTDLCKVKVPAIVHLDGTARPQVLKRNRNEYIWNLIQKYKGISGVGVLINTSFNIHEEPIVCTEEEAFKSAQKAGLDYLVVNGQLYKNTQQER